MTVSNLQNIRREYILKTLDESHVNKDPFEQFSIWLKEAEDSNVMDLTAFQLATVNDEGQPTLRIVLLKGIDKKGFVFFTNYESRKGYDLLTNPRAAIGFYWAEIERQVRIEGSVHKLSLNENETYFKSRPYESQLGAWASKQSSVVPNRKYLEDEMVNLRSKYKEGNVPCPENWGGYRLIPSRIEFWQGRSGRLHDRVDYLYNGRSWIINRLSP